MKKQKLYCFPYAGGSAGIYNVLKEYVDKSVEIVPIEYPGRGARYVKKLCRNINEIVEDAYEMISEDICSAVDYSFFGYSMGSIIAYELAMKIKRMKLKEPNTIFFAAQEALSCKHSIGDIDKLTDLEFKEKLRQYGGTDKVILENDQLFEIVLPIVKSDFSIFNNYNFVNDKAKLNSNIVTINGDKDQVIQSEIEEWRTYTNKAFDMYMLKGDHFFINNNFRNIATIINKNLINEN